MEEPQQHQTLLDDEATLIVSGEETTLVAPRFDDEETLVARPVVPFERDAHAAPVPERRPARPAHDYRSAYAPRRSLTLALVLVSVLIGGVLGGAGLYLYQRQSQDPTMSPAAATTQQPADAAQAPAAPATEGQATPMPPQSDAQVTAVPNAEEPAPPAHDEEAPAAAPAREPENVPATERRTAPAEEGRPKRGKKGTRDEEIARRTTSQPGGNVARADGSIFDRPRRATRRTRRDDDVDRLRRIFEGTPQ